MRILEQMPAWTEEVTFPPAGADPSAARPDAAEALDISGVPWVTILLLLACGWVLFAAGGVRSGVALPGLLLYGAKATPLILDRGETWRLFSANLLHKDLLHFAFNAFALWNVGGALERAVRPADYLALLVFTARGTTLISAVGSDSISLGASGMAFGVLGASAAFGWRGGGSGSVRPHLRLRVRCLPRAPSGHLPLSAGGGACRDRCARTSACGSCLGCWRSLPPEWAAPAWTTGGTQ